jgi:hypothetical protein
MKSSRSLAHLLSHDLTINFATVHSSLPGGSYVCLWIEWTLMSHSPAMPLAHAKSMTYLPVPTESM